MPLEFTTCLPQGRFALGPRLLPHPSAVIARPATHHSYRSECNKTPHFKINQRSKVIVRSVCVVPGLLLFQCSDQWNHTKVLSKHLLITGLVKYNLKKDKANLIALKKKKISISISVLRKKHAVHFSGGLAQFRQRRQHPGSSKEEFVVHRRPGRSSQSQPVSVTPAVTCRELLTLLAEEGQRQQSGGSCE